MTTSSDNINNSPNEQMQWPHGENCQFLILPVTVSSKVMMDAQSFICGNCYYYDKEEGKRKPQIVSKAIQMEALFTEAAGHGTDDSNLMDYQRFQTNPSRQTSLLKSPAIAAIVSATQCMIDSQVTGYWQVEINRDYMSTTQGQQKTKKEMENFLVYFFHCGITQNWTLQEIMNNGKHTQFPLVPYSYSVVPVAMEVPLI
jgi:hypothetical protein